MLPQPAAGPVKPSNSLSKMSTLVKNTVSPAVHNPPLLISDVFFLDNQDSEWRYAALTEGATFTLVHRFSTGLNSVGIYPDRLTAGALGHGPRDR